jgi:diphthamide synthase subunit DPH2
MEPKKSYYRHITRLKVHEIEELRDSQFSAVISQKLEENLEIRQALKAQRIDAKDFEKNPQLLEHLMKLGTESTLQVFMFGYDELSKRFIDNEHAVQIFQGNL